MALLTLVIPFRNRHSHLREMLRYFSAFHPGFEIEYIILESAATPTLHNHEWPDERFRYEFVEQPGVFHKTVLLNKGLMMSKGEFIIAYDVDLIPVADALSRAVETARSSDKILISGYRLMGNELGDQDEDDLEIGPEDRPTSLKKYLLGRELFGVCPVYRKERLLEIGGWDEHFKGWGAEDQDITERYCKDRCVFVRSPQILYLHLHHEKQEGWNISELTIKNRQYYAAKKLERND
jgi:N-terminal domain of galactosyltransferase